MIIIGIDPGITGAWSIFDHGYCTAVEDMPVFDTRVDGGAVAGFLRTIEPDLVVIEDTQPMPKNGSIASFKLGLNTGIVIGCVQTEGFAMMRVRPATWKRSAGLIGKPKDAARGLVVELCPHLADRVRLVKHQGRADAILIGRYGVYHNIHTQTGEAQDEGRRDDHPAAHRAHRVDRSDRGTEGDPHTGQRTDQAEGQRVVPLRPLAARSRGEEEE